MVAPQILPSDIWEKEAPAEYDKNTNTIFFRLGYDPDKDCDGWIVHEMIHAHLASINFEDNYNPPIVEYPFNDIERYAFTWQFVYLLEIQRIHFVGDIKNVMPWEFDRFGEHWAKKYFNVAKEKVRNDDEDIPPSSIHGGGRFDSSIDLQLEEKFREIVDNAKKKFLANNSLQSNTDLKQHDKTIAIQTGLGCIWAAIIIATVIIATAVAYTL